MRTPCLDLRLVKFFLLIPALALVLNGCGFFTSQRSASGLAVAKTAKKYLGTPYVMGGKTPKAFDCSGLTSYVYKKHGVALPRASSKQAKAGRYIKKRQLRPGDLVFFATGKRGRVSHVGIYVGDDKFIHAPGTGKKVTTSSLSAPYYIKTYHSARRVL